MGSSFLEQAYGRLRHAVQSIPDDTLPSPALLQAAKESLPKPADGDYLEGRGAEATLQHLLKTIVPGLNGQNLSGRYYGFVTGSTVPIAEAADNIVSALDQNVQVHLPDQSVSTIVEDAALKMLVKLLDLGDPDDWPGRTFTTGATGSNILGLACGREAVIASRLPKGTDQGVGELGLLGACQAANVKEIQVLTSMGHSSLSKAASIVGLGRSAVKELPASAHQPWRLDLDAVEGELVREGVASIIAISAGEVNTGGFATQGIEDLRRLRSLSDRYNAWIHVDGAFGIFARALPSSPDFETLRDFTAGLELADSITVDGHKLLNVPYDNGIFFTRNSSILTNVFKNPNAAYLASAGGAEIPSPLNIGLENSRRFRALPVYAVLLSEGKDGVAEILARMVYMARRVADFIKESPDYELLPNEEASRHETHMVVLFRAKRPELNDILVQKVNETRQMYVSGTGWKGQKACRIAVSSWRVDIENDFAIVKDVLTRVAAR